ncbi:hypothetical protein DRQ33_05495 [bacterium]|nr:MAG: hypothetical protein DRQ33_05495 [bacterium]
MNHILKTAEQYINNAKAEFQDGNKNNAISLLEIAVRSAIAQLEKKYDMNGLGLPLQDRIARFTNDYQLVNMGKVIDDLFNPVLRPIGLDHGTEQPKYSAQQTLIAIEYAECIIDFVRKEIGKENE